MIVIDILILITMFSRPILSRLSKQQPISSGERPGSSGRPSKCCLSTLQKCKQHRTCKMRNTKGEQVHNTKGEQVHNTKMTIYGEKVYNIIQAQEQHRYQRLTSIELDSNVLSSVGSR